MALFNFGKKKDKKDFTCGCNASIESQEDSFCCCGGTTIEIEECCCGNEAVCGSIQSIKVLGAGCKSCHVQYENVLQAVQNLEISVEVEYITDLEKVMTYGVMSMPAIVINEKVVSMGKVLNAKDVEKLLQNKC